MKIDNLRSIGQRLIRELHGLGETVERTAVVGIGAGGDKTYAIDRRAEEIIIDGLMSAGRPLTIISEEAGIIEHRGGGHIALVDPIDGSRNAAAGIPFFCASIAIAEGSTLGTIYLSYVVNLISGDEFWAEKGEGAFLNGRKVDAEEDDELRMVAYEAQSPSKDIQLLKGLLSQSRKTRCFGATALDLAYVSCGSISVMSCPSPSRSFDFGGGYLLVRESGGIVTDGEGADISHIALGLKRSSTLLASGNEKLHGKALSLLTRKEA